MVLIFLHPYKNNKIENNPLFKLKNDLYDSKNGIFNHWFSSQFFRVIHFSLETIFKELPQGLTEYTVVSMMTSIHLLTVIIQYNLGDKISH